jgi:hypothetical protein
MRPTTKPCGGMPSATNGSGLAPKSTTVKFASVTSDSPRRCLTAVPFDETIDEAVPAVLDDALTASTAPASAAVDALKEPEDKT